MGAAPPGSWGWRRLSLGGEITVMGAHGQADRRRRAVMLAIL